MRVAPSLDPAWRQARWLGLAGLIALAACSRTQPGEAASFAGAPVVKAAGEARRQLAYEHAISVDVDEEQVAPLATAVEAACAAAAASDACAVLESRIDSGRLAAATLRLRARPAGIAKVTAVLAQRGQVVRRSTSAEDVAAPVDDVARKLAMLSAYRAKLEALLGRAQSDVDALIKINRELAQTQSDIDAASGVQARLAQRVETELLAISISPRGSGAFWRPVGEALGDFSGHLSAALAGLVTALAYLLPWLAVLAGFAWAGRAAWRRRRR